MAAEREIAAEDSIKVVCRFRPLNDSEEKAGSKFIVKFPSGPDENCITIGVCFSIDYFHYFFKACKFLISIKHHLFSLVPYRLFILISNLFACNFNQFLLKNIFG